MYKIRNRMYRTFLMLFCVSLVCLRSAGIANAQPAKDATSWFIEGRDAYNKGDFDKAITACSEAIRLKPDFANAYEQRGWALFGKGQQDKAYADFDEAIRLGTQSASAFYGRGWTWYSKGDNDKAIADYSEAVRLNPGYSLAFNNRGVAWFAKGDNDRAIADFNDAIRLNPQLTLAFSGRGLAWYNKREYQKAYDDYREAIRLDANHVPALKRLAWLMATCPVDTLRNGKEAVELARRAMVITRDWDAMEVLAAAYAEAGDFASAVSWQEQSLKEPGMDAGSAEAARIRLELYRGNRPCRDVPAAEPGPGSNGASDPPGAVPPKEGGKENGKSAKANPGKWKVALPQPASPGMETASPKKLLPGSAGEIVQQLIENLQNQDDGVRTEAICQVARAYPQTWEAVPALQKLTNDSNANVRHLAQCVMNAIERTEADPSARPFVSAAIIDHRHKLLKDLQSSDAGVRLQGVNALSRLGAFGKVATLPSVIKLAEDPDPKVRSAALDFLQAAEKHLAQRRVVRMGFDDLPAKDGSIHGGLLEKYLAIHGITVADLTTDTRLEVMDMRTVYGGKAARAPSFPNILTQTGSTKGVSFTLRFNQPLYQFSFTRAGLVPSSSGVTHPLWRASALDAKGELIDWVGEKQISSYVDVLPAPFTLYGPGIRAVRFEANARDFAAFGSVLIDDLLLFSESGTLDPLAEVTLPSHPQFGAEPYDLGKIKVWLPDTPRPGRGPADPGKLKIALPQPTASNEYLTGEGQLKHKLVVKDTGGFAGGGTGQKWIIEPGGEWLRVVKEKDKLVETRGKLSSEALRGLAKELARLDLLHLPREVNKMMVADGFNVVIEFGEHRSLFFGKAGFKDLPRPGNDSPEARFAAIVRAVWQAVPDSPR